MGSNRRLLNQSTNPASRTRRLLTTKLDRGTDVALARGSHTVSFRERRLSSMLGRSATRPRWLPVGIFHCIHAQLDQLNNVFGHGHVLQFICQFGAGAI